MSNELAITENSNMFIAPVANVSVAIQRYQDMQDFIKGVLRSGVDFGIIPGTKEPTLLKPGAEKLATFFGLATTFSIIEKVEDWTGNDHAGEPFFYYWYKCITTRNGRTVAEGEGSANSFEKKYRYRSSNMKCPACGNETIIKGKDEYGGGWLCFAKKGGCGAKFRDGDKSIEDQPRGQVKNPDIADIVNTLQKMAQKRAYVAAVLLAVNGSEYFTQDMEDFIIDGQVTILEPEPVKREAAKKASKPVEPQNYKLQAVSTNTMSLETAENITNRDGVRYGDIETDKLSYMASAILKVIDKNGLDAETHDEHKMKIDAINIILSSRNGEAE